MQTLSMKERFDLDRVVEPEDRAAYLLVQYLSLGGHGDWMSCGVAEFDLIGFSEALDSPPGEMLRRLKRVADLVGGVCVEHENMVLFAIPGARQDGFDHLYKRNGFIGLPPNLRPTERDWARI